jgi:hypothetical protein
MKEIIYSVNRNKKTITEKEIKILQKETKCFFCKIDIQKHGKTHGREDAVVRSCSMCYHFEHLDEFSNIDKGTNILLPELTQIELFGVIRMIWFMKSLEESGNYVKYEETFDSINNLYQLIQDRRDFASSYYAQGVDNVEIMVNFLHGIEDDAYSQRKDGLSLLRWLPPENSFEQEKKYWESTEFKKYTPKNFKPLIKKVAALISSKNKKG